MAENSKAGRPSRWDAPFDPKMTGEIVDQILAIPPFSAMEAEKFPRHLPLREIFLNDTRVNRYRKGDIVVRVGDYGNSAFFILKGAAHVLGHNAAPLPEAALGLSDSKKKNWKEAVAQLWKNSSIPGYRAKVRHQASDTPDPAAAAIRSDEDGTRIFLQDISAIISEGKTIELKLGEFFGEIAALGRTPRTATVVAAEDGLELLEIKWQGLRDIRSHAPQFKEHIDRLYRERSLQSHLRETTILSHLDEATIAIIAENTQFKSFGNFDGYGQYKKMAEHSARNRLDDEPIIVGEGEYADSLVLVRSGFARLSEKSGNGHRTVSYFGRGQYFGFREIANNWKNNSSVPYEFSMRAVGLVDVLIIPTKVVEQYILPTLPKEKMPWPETFQDKKSRYSSEELEIRAKNKRVSTDVLEFMVEQRIMNGTATMLIDLDRCTRCDDCVRACATAHDGNPRFVREGKQVEHWMVANACMHCQDPVCLIGCPTGAIHRKPDTGQIVVNDLTCIGCTVCAESCPYENIKMETTRTATNEFILDAEAHRPIMKATKCDLCADQLGGPACERACPHDAMVRVDMRDYPKLAKWLNR